MSWQESAIRKRRTLQSKLGAIRDVQGAPYRDDLTDATVVAQDYLSAEDLDLTNNSLAVLQAKLANGSISAVRLVKAFLRRAVLAHQLTNCLMDLLAEEATRRAESLDAQLARTGKPVGSLHGLPISLKDQFRVEGAETTLGYVGWLGRKEGREDASLVTRILEAAGAIVIAKTNVPSSLMVHIFWFLDVVQSPRANGLYRRWKPTTTL